MKHTGIALLLMAVLLSGCVDGRGDERRLEKVQEESSEAVEAAGTFLDREAGQARESMKRGIDDLEREIRRLQKESRNATEEARPEIERQIDRLKAARTDAESQLDQLNQATKENWKDLKRDFEGFRENAAEESRQEASNPPDGRAGQKRSHQR